jgi:succinate-acetate transporter protein
MLHRNMSAMIERYELFGPSHERFGNPAPLGLLGLTIACAALVPIAFGQSLGPGAFRTASLYALLFGGGCQLLAGLMLFANKSSFGGTVFTCFSFLWGMNAWGFHELSQGRVPDHAVGLAVEVALFVIFVALTWGFGHFARALFLFLLDIDLLFAFRIVRSVTHTRAMELPIALATVGLGLVGLWLALGALLGPVAGRVVLPLGPPVFHAKRAPGFDWTLRRALFSVLYAQWREAAQRPLAMAELRARVAEAGAPSAEPGALEPDLFYLAELGFVVLQTSPGDPHEVVSARLHAKGVDIHEQLVLGKYTPAAPAH